MATRRSAGIDAATLRIFIEMAVLVGVLILCLVLIGKLWATEPAQVEQPGGTTEQPEQTTNQTTVSTTETTVPVDTSPEGIFQAFLQEHNLTEADYTEQMLENYQLYPETREFILNYPLEKDKEHTADISWADRSQGVPLFMQWDDRWGYTPYGKTVGGISGCGPTCLSMVAFYLTGDTKYTPAYMMEFAAEDGHVGVSGGTQWTLFSRGAVNLGFHVEELPLSGSILINRLEKGIPVVINVGPGDFTQYGHYIVLTGYADGYIRVNDPNSRANSEKQWTYEQIEDQIKNLWAISLP